MADVHAGSAFFVAHLASVGHREWLEVLGTRYLVLGM